MNEPHGHVRAYWRGCRCTPCRAAFSQYHSTYMERAGRKALRIVTGQLREQMRLNFSSSAELARKLEIPQGMAYRLYYGRTLRARPQVIERLKQFMAAA